jgi:hypothetical protein
MQAEDIAELIIAQLKLKPTCIYQNSSIWSTNLKSTTHGKNLRQLISIEFKTKKKFLMVSN